MDCHQSATNHNLTRLALILPTVVVSLAAISLLSVPTAHASGGTNVSDTLITNTTSTITGSPYIVVGDVSVSGGVTLTVDPAVVVRFNNFQLSVDGTLYAVGTSAQTITFTSNAGAPARLSRRPYGNPN